VSIPKEALDEDLGKSFLNATLAFIPPLKEWIVASGAFKKEVV
jgi:hypothetical protein